MSVPSSSPYSTQVNQVDYIEALEEDLRRESQARRILQALVNQRTRTLATYIERFGDITGHDDKGKGDGDDGAVGDDAG